VLSCNFNAKIQKEKVIWPPIRFPLVRAVQQRIDTSVLQPAAFLRTAMG
jgi:hypothetical protein